MRKIAQGATEATRILTLSSEGGGYVGQEAQHPEETHHKNQKREKSVQFSKEGSLQRSHPCYTAHKISFHSFGSNISYFKGPGTTDSV